MICETESLSPFTKRRVEASIHESDSGVRLEKSDETGRSYSVVLEPDVSLYHLLSGSSGSGRKHYTIYASAECNLKCRFCYESSSCLPVSPEQLKEFLRDKKRKYIILGGREPTCNPRLPELIRIAAERNYAYIITNGLRLADYNYLQELKRAGLKYIHFSLNALRDSVYEDIRMNGQPLVKEKIAALDNIRKAGMKVSVGFTVVKGLNESQIRDVFNYCSERPDFIEELRVRAAVPYGPGDYGNSDEYYRLSELIGLFCSACALEREGIINETNYIKSLKSLRPSLEGIQHCGLWFHYEMKKKQLLFGGKRCKYPQNYSFFGLITMFLKKFGFEYASRGFDALRCIFCGPSFSAPSRLLRVQFRCWPNIYSVDLSEWEHCSNYYYKDNLLTPFCLRHILNRTEEAKKAGY